MSLGFSDHVVYVDESGDHGLSSIDPSYPVFVLAFCIFQKSAYSQEAVPSLQELKFRHFGHDQVVLHEREIHKALPPFDFLLVPDRRRQFMADLNALVTSSPFTLIASVIDKIRLQSRYQHPSNPYEIALLFGMERVAKYLRRHDDCEALTHFVFESRGKKEDDDLELAFRRICDERRFTFEPVFSKKGTNSAGLQIADLLARPIGRHVLKPGQTNRAFEIIRKKFDCPYGKTDGYGLKVFPRA